MATFNLRRFASPDTLRTIREENLRALFLRHGEYFERRGVNLGGVPANRAAEAPFSWGDGTALAAERDSLDYEALAAVLVTPDDDTPQPLIDALYLIHEMATEEGMEALLTEVEAMPEEERMTLGKAPDLTPADLAVQVWLRAPEIIERKHAERVVGEKRSFEYFLSEKLPAGGFPVPSRTRIEALERELGAWFSSKKKGEIARVFVYQKPGEAWFLVRHGETFRREGAIRGGLSVGVSYRPEKHDVLIYNQALGELGIHAGTKGEKEIYRRTFGRHLFTGEDHFPASNEKYALKPLRTDGRNSLVCADVGGIDAVVLSEITYFWGGAHNEIEVRKAGDLFAALESRDGKIQAARIVGAKFRVKFSDSKTPRMVSIRPPNIARVTRDDDGKLVEDWLRKRGFILGRPEEAEDEEERAVLAGS